MRAAKSERDTFSKQSQKYIGYVEFRQTAWPYANGNTKTRCLQIYFHLVSEYYQTTSSLDVGLSKTMARPMELRRYVFKFFLVNDWRDILDCSCKWLYFSNSCWCIGPKHDFSFPLMNRIHIRVLPRIDEIAARLRNKRNILSNLVYSVFRYHLFVSFKNIK